MPMRIFERAAEQTRRVRAQIVAELGEPDGDQWERKCGTCGLGKMPLDVAETTKRTLRSGVLSLVWDGKECGECDLRRRIMRVGVPESLTHARIENWDHPGTPEAVATLGKVAAYASAPVGFLILRSAVFGCGKSHLAAGVVADLIRRGRRARFLTHAEFLIGLRGSYSGSATNPTAITAASDFLVIDDVGVSTGGADDLPTLRAVLTERHAHKRPTVITTNIDAAAFTELLGEHLTSRLRESTFAWIEVPGEGRRAHKRAEYIGVR